MLYRELGSTGEKVSILGFGCMRLPTLENKPYGKIDEKEASKILNYGIENGVNYLDTAYSYHANEGDETNSETFLGDFLETQNREKLLLSTKLPSWLVENKEDMDKFVDEQLARLKQDYIDVYLLHSINEDYWKKLVDYDVFEFLDKLKSNGTVKYVGFSFHDEIDLFMEMMDSYKWDVVLTQLNYLDENYQAGLMGVQYSSQVGLGNIIMEPLRGGSLANNVPTDIQNIWNNFKVKRSPAEWAFRYLWNIEEVDVVLSGMNSLEDVKENIRFSDKGIAKSLTDEESMLIKDVARLYKDRIKVDCTECGYCLPCKEGVAIPKCLKEYNLSYMLNDKKATHMQYFTQINKEERAFNCTKCGDCKLRCPQMIDIPNEMDNVKKLFDDYGQDYD